MTPLRFVLAGLVVGLGLFSPAFVHAQKRMPATSEPWARAWARVEAFESEGLPRSAAAVVDSIRQAARAQGDEPQFLRAVLYATRYRTMLEESGPDSVLLDLRSALASASVPGRAVLHSVLGELYFRYFQENSWRFQGRTTTAAPDTADVTTWDLRTILRAATDEYLRSLEPLDTDVGTCLTNSSVLPSKTPARVSL